MSPALSSLGRHDVAPLMMTYGLFLAGATFTYRRRSRAPRQEPSRPHPSTREDSDVPSSPRPARWTTLIRSLGVVTIGGYVAFLAVVTLFYGLVGNEPWSFVVDAARGGALLAFVVAMPSLALLGSLEGIRKSDRNR